MKFFSILNNSDKRYHPLLENFLFHLNKASVTLAHEVIPVEGRWAPFNTARFNNVAMNKLSYASKLLREGSAVFCTDLDIVFLRDPTDYLMELLKEYDVVFQRMGNSHFPGELPICTGFFAARPNPLCVDLFDETEEIEFMSKDRSDQGYIRSKLEVHKEKYKTLKIKILDPELFSIYSPHVKEKNPYIIHYCMLPAPANPDLTLVKKIEAIKKQGLWHSQSGK